MILVNGSVTSLWDPIFLSLFGPSVGLSLYHKIATRPCSPLGALVSYLHCDIAGTADDDGLWGEGDVGRVHRVLQVLVDGVKVRHPPPQPEAALLLLSSLLSTLLLSSPLLVQAAVPSSEVGIYKRFKIKRKKENTLTAKKKRKKTRSRLRKQEKNDNDQEKRRKEMENAN